MFDGGGKRKANKVLSPIKVQTEQSIIQNYKNSKIKVGEGDASGEGEDDPKKKDKFGASRLLKVAIEKKYEFIEVLGRGSYGCVSKGRCKATGRIVALKIMENQTDTEYDTIKLVREVQLMRRLNRIQQRLEQ